VGKFKIEFAKNFLEDYESWKKADTRTLRKINALMRATEADPVKGIGKPEPLRHQLSGSWSRRIDLKHRLVYRLAEDKITFLSCRGHYG
jgi:toxin YoeB